MHRLSLALKRPCTTRVLIEQNVLFSEVIVQELRSLSHRFALCCDPYLMPLGQQWCAFLQDHGLLVELFPVSPHKTNKAKEALEHRLFSSHFGKEHGCIALGGGALTDLVGFVASTYCRGIPLVFVPTTLLAMVDAAIGGKTGIDTPYGKNLIGSFYPASSVYIDPLVLRSLPVYEWTLGMAEVIKYALIDSSSLFAQLEQFPLHDPLALPSIIEQSLNIKAKIVQSDYDEKGMRRLLNFGHTIGHALEWVEGYQLPHGEAVAIGMLIESYLSVLCGYLSYQDFKKIDALIGRFPFRFPLSTSITEEKIFTGLSRDKKGIEGVPRFVLLEGIGSPCTFEGAYCSEIPPALLRRGLKELIYTKWKRSHGTVAD